MKSKTASISIIVLVIFKIISVYFTEFALYGDEAQYWIWAKSPDLGYFSKPPLLAWFLFGYIGIFGDSFFSLKLFPIIIYFFISFTIYKICLCLYFSKNDSVLCAIGFFIIPAASLSSFLISTDLLLLLFWSLTLIKLLETRSNPSILNFFLMGLFLGLAFLAKYAAIYFFISLVFLLILDNKSLAVCKKNPLGVIIFFLSTSLILLPNLYWNLNNSWVTLSHTSDNANLNNLNFNLFEPLKFLTAQAIMLGPVLFFSFFFLFKHFFLDFENKFLLIFSMPVIFIVLVESLLVRANANWAAPALISIYILLFKLVNKKNTKLIQINFLSNYVIALLLFGAILISSKNQIFERISGVNVFLKEITEVIGNEDIVVSNRIIFSNISYGLKDKSNKIFMPYKKGRPVTNHFQMSSPLNQNHKNKFFLIGNLSDLSYLSKKHQGRLIKEFAVPFNSTNLKLYEVIFK